MARLGVKEEITIEVKERVEVGTRRCEVCFLIYCLGNELKVVWLTWDTGLRDTRDRMMNAEWWM